MNLPPFIGLSKEISFVSLAFSEILQIGFYHKFMFIKSFPSMNNMPKFS